MGRSRSRSRSRSRGRRKTRSRSRDRRSRSRERIRAAAAEVGNDAMQAMQTIAALQQQQQLQMQLMAQHSQQHQMLIAQQHQQAIAAQVMAQTVNPAADLALDAAPTATNKKQRELYIGNLCVGVVTPDIIRELFNSLLNGMVSDPINQPPVMEIKMDTSGRFAFVEFRSAALALAVLQLDKLEVAGRPLNVGRPKGYIEPPVLEQQAKLSQAQMFAAAISGGPTNVVVLDNLMPAHLLNDEQERRDLYDDVYVEASKCGAVVGMAIPLPPPGFPETMQARVYIKYTSQEAAEKCKKMMDGREFDDRKVKCMYSSEDAFYKAQGNEWPPLAVP